MTIPLEAVEAGAKGLLAHGTIVPELRQAKGDWESAGWTIQQEFIAMSNAVLIAALPRIRELIAQEIEALEPTAEMMTHRRDEYEYSAGWEEAAGDAAVIARGR